MRTLPKEKNVITVPGTGAPSPGSQMARQELLCDFLALDALHIVFLHPGYRYSYFAQVSGGGRIKLTLRRQLRELNACTSGWYRNWQTRCLLAELYDKVLRLASISANI